ncbi:TRAP transporter large permease [Phaeobacter gallaeciensis]|uniref:TRAP transporter large permease n=1 Tax=Phaeobacter gallaeciensis TaxID=60890 RepID=UPI00237F7504|nr:TRAP transporter large permease [Phaeobacter gallaeciensis]MDE4305919.1 TRAP transporter large permease [Phaeobacter gallaeciensis]MDE4310268.1 TRAP transporter large permease [Phaeobacter gallaeciensis]MDE4314618.1 TRAP transporter large permease [Phaeobacter gallaeciensis]MDE4319197.1 TRAP transporter large permease [Phaeobacter gallaeciensis]MDE4323984.1 TRAP transporter large permease [Phaeobacter gallaeciensis]
MDPATIFLFALLGLFVLLALRMPIAIALAIVSALGILAIRGPRAALSMVGSETHDFAAHWTLSAIPMFLLMGAFAFQGGLTTSLFKAGRIWLSRLPGGLAVATNAATAMFAASSGSSIATSAAMTRLAAPEMLKAGYAPSLATSVIACAGTIGALIPPSILFVVYAWFAQENVGQLLMAGLLPGLLTAGAYTLLIIVRVKMNPALAPKVEDHFSWSDRMNVLKEIWPIPFLMVVVMGSIYGGFATATEAAALGSIATLLLVILRGNFSWTFIRDAVNDAVTSSASVFLVALGAALFSKLLALSGIPPMIGDFIETSNMSALQLVFLVIALYLVLGMFLDPIGILLITLPILLPAFDALEMNLIWMGVIIVKMIEIGLLTPPVGLNVFVVKGVLGDQVELKEIFKGVMWFLLAEIVIMGLIIGFPEISLLLPNMME